MNVAENYNVFVGVIESVTDSSGKHYLDSLSLKVRVHVLHGTSTTTPLAALSNSRLTMSMYEKCFNYSQKVDVYLKAEKVFPIYYPDIWHDTAVSSPQISASRLDGLQFATNYTNQTPPIPAGFSKPQYLQKGDRVLVCAPDGDFTNLIIFDKV